MPTFLSKLKKINSIIKQLTFIIKSIKDFGEILFYTFLTFYIGHDKIFKKNKTEDLIPIDIDNVLSSGPPPSPTSSEPFQSISNEHDLLFYSDLLKVFVMSVLFGITIIKIKNLIIKYKN